jgi:hypothetical protein
MLVNRHPGPTLPSWADGIVEYANNMLAQIAESSQREAQA